MWNNRNFWILMVNEAIAGLALWFGLIGNLEFLQQNVPSDFLKACLLMTAAFVAVLFGPLAGKVVDRTEKRKVLFVSGFARIVAVGSMLIALQTDSVWWMLGYTMMVGAASAFYFPALQSLLPMIIKEEHLTSANGFHMNVGTVSRILGTAAGGVLLVSVSLQSLYLLALVLYVLMQFTPMLLQVEEKIERVPDKSGKKQSTQFKDVLPIITGSPVIVMALLLTLAPSIFIGSFNLMVIAVSEIQQDPTVKGVLYTVEGLSFMVGAFLARRAAKGRNLLNLLVFCSLMIGVATLALYPAEMKWAPIFAFGLFGISAGVLYPLVATLFQTTVPKEYHGRFFSFRGMMDRVLFQVFMLLTGLFLDTIGFKPMILLFAAVAFFFALRYSWLQLRSPIAYDGHKQKAA
ncbi:MFS transporter [Tumebacillus sp. DT12]|uniref:MFS transporter n=1 Tax=Tumebacillus lacus TaxID=2995335 RepID=A0ABT3X1B5_9BACL|nr:MFS transporter [Tumebacillus lacus]MCX7568489.1 MFS transporter [Tumebacillus lacus]